jgi:hypothetical protein
MTDESRRGRIADLPPEARRAAEVERQGEIDEGLTRRHVANAAYERAHLAVQLARAVPILAAKLRGR